MPPINEKIEQYIKIINALSFFHKDIISDLNHALKQMKNDNDFVSELENKNMAKMIPDEELKQYIQKNLSAVLLKVQEEKNFNINEFAKVLHLAPNTMKNILNGKGLPTTVNLIRIHLFTGIPFDSLLFAWNLENYNYIHNDIMQPEKTPISSTYSTIDELRKAIEERYLENGAIDEELKVLLACFDQKSNEQMAGMIEKVELENLTLTQLKENILRSIAKAIKRQREDRGLNKAQMARLLGVKPHMIYNSEAEEHLANPAIIVLMHYKLGLSFEKILLNWE